MTDTGAMHPHDGWWDTLSAPVQDLIDELLCTGRMIAAIVLLRGDDGLRPRPALYEAQDLLAERRAELDRQGRLPPEPPPLTTEQLLEKVVATTAPVAAIEALWDGDSQGWFVELAAIVRRPGPNHDRFDAVTLTALRRGGDIRLFNGQVPPWPEAHRATEQGRALAQHLGVPFHFTSPDTPDIDLPRWWDTQPT
ncbi:hypothetical protein [Dactylosporangium matsuzakiense]|uniref:Uncharacterized protein n=1 Tax=Dactylosporangium matsuzakiense TaxID=53360 RepID=A0A9W6KIY0_9ACTN|nr:hypothetical protein [Dactylosporangium matsuzakiense]UWZ48796.1 hypothetical protein Dmats_21775 [Dactylosporangium matsuzakiense]GLL01101.1 hypothetical protein GCM10017581_028420 [Dactylosporangium matsuzakiense]